MVLPSGSKIQLFDFDDLDFGDLDLEDLGKAARDAVDSFNGEEEPSDEVLGELENEQESLLSSDSLAPVMDFSSMKVAELKSELKTRGLPVSGKKAELVARLEEYEEQ